MSEKLDWLFVKKSGCIVFVATKNGIPFKKFKDVNLAYHYCEQHDFKNTIADFNKETSKLIEERMNGKNPCDERKIIGIHDFKRILKELDTVFLL